MKKQLIQFTFIAILMLGFGTVFGQWVIYDCSDLPENTFMGDSAWVEQDNTDFITDNGVSDLFSVVEDPDIEGNHLIQVEELIGDRKESFINNWNIEDPSVGVTCVFRTKPSQGILDAQADDDNDYRYCYVSLRNGQWREEFRLDYPGVIDINYIDQVVEFPEVVDWHIYRFTLKGAEVNIYVDENPEPLITGITDKSVDQNYIKIGDSSTGGMHGCLFDWVIWDKSGAYAPGEGTALPSELTGLETGIAEKGTTVPSNLQLLQNYPNPFNPVTMIEYKVSTASSVTLDVYNTIGHKVRSLVNANQTAGDYRVTWNGQDDAGNQLPSGIYFYRLQAGQQVEMKKMTMMK